MTYLLLFFTPLFFLPWAQDVLEPNKQMILVVLTVTGLVAWFGSCVMQKRCEFRSGLVNIAPAVFLFCVLVSSVFSKATYQTWVGQSSQEYASFLTIALLVCVFYLYANVHEDVIAQRHALFALLSSAAIAGIFSMLQLFHVFLLPFAFAKSIAFNTVGTFSSMTLFLLISMFLGLSLWLVSQEGGDRIIPSGGSGVLMRALIFIVCLISLFSLIVVDSWVFWVVTIFGVLLLTSFGFLRTKEFPSSRRFIFPLILLSVSLFFLFLPSPQLFKLPLLVSPNFETSWHVAQSTLLSNVPDLLFGSGPGTFSYQYSLFKPMGVNVSPFWEYVFDRSASAFLTRLSDVGILGSLAWVVCMGWIGALAVKRLVSVRDHQTWKMTYVLFVGWSMLVLTQMLYSSNITFEFLLWALSGMLVAHLLPSVWKTDFARSPKLGLLASFVFVFGFMGMFVSVLLMGGRFLGEKAFVQAVKLDAKRSDTQQVVGHLQDAVRFNSLNDTYTRNLSFALFLQASQKIQGLKGQKMTAEQTKDISERVSASIQMGTRATALEPNKVANWQFLGMLYREVMPFAENAETLAANAFTNTIRLEPTNPAHFVDLARVYLAVSDRARALKRSENADQAKQAAEQEQKLLGMTEEALNRAIQLKGDYLPAHYYLAATYDREGKLDQATKRLVALVKNAPSDVGLGFELAQLYIRTKNLDTAKQELERLITINPQYANALWYLASVYEMQNNREKAIEFVEKVLKLNPENKAVQDRLQKLQTGQDESALPEPIQPQAQSVR
ncbi:hypothetical protein A2318_03235 [Candidatus Uhrbacteria bacterium RIFOXYB2_FULL_45_11]|uniref:Uncharacterized protein n=1 Tax=Candidatus Uhrbacteria bacterium RIFOXYB2_FULL_45_11 TaxID=1802421 RepID=A0A1F7W3N7_9BACT|nr:MAG: hypothetical protein A2318_03235 [Candidatus Uhrbacteria bacterium RIFOXYB2_FULL_45_11]